MKSQVLEFLKKGKIVTLATLDKEGNPWICNVHFGVDENLNIYFVSKKDSNHAVHIENNSSVAFTVFTFNLLGNNDKASVQAKGVATTLSSVDEIEIGAKTILEKFPGWVIKPEDVTGDNDGRRMYKITPTYLKHLDDIVLGDKKTEEYSEEDLKTS